MARPVLADLVRHAQIPESEATEHAVDLQEHLDAAISNVEAKCGPMDDGTKRIKMRSPRMLLLPFGEIETVSVVDGDDVAVEVDERHTDYEAGIIGVKSRECGDYFTVTFTRGDRATAALRLAALLIAAHLWDTRRGGSGTGGAFGSPDAMYAPGAGFAVPRRAAELMAPFMTPVVA